MAGLTALAAEFDPFLYATIGTEPNGCELTIVSLIARLDADPWGEAARLADQPAATAVDWLAQRIALTRLSGMGAVDARPAAARLVLLLPTPGTRPQATSRSPIGAAEVPGWAILVMVLGAFILGAAMSASPSPPSPERTTPQGTGTTSR